MRELIVRKVAFSYSPVEDRLEMRCLVQGEMSALWLSQRMWKQLLPLLVNWLIKSGFGTSRSADFVRHSLQQAQATSQLNKPLAKNNMASDAEREKNALFSSSSNDGSSVQQGKSSGVWLCSKASLSLGDERARIRLEAGEGDPVYMFSMTPLEASHFLVAQRQALQNADWPYDWPSWLLLENDIETSPHAEFLH